MKKIINFMKNKYNSFVETKEQGSLAAVLGVAVVIATVTLTLGAYSIAQVGISKTSESQNNMNSSIADVTSNATQQMYSKGTVNLTVNQLFQYSAADTVVTVKEVTVLPATSTIQGVKVTMEASWRNGERTAKQTKLIPVPLESVKSAAGVILGFDVNGNAIWG